MYFSLSHWFRRWPLLARLLGGECHGNLQEAGPAATSWWFRVYFLKESITWLEENLVVSNEALKYVAIVFFLNLPWLSSDC